MNPISTTIRLFLVIVLTILVSGNSVYGQNKAAIKASEYADRLQYADAIDLWLRAIKKDPTNAGYYEQLGFTYKKLNQYSKAENAFYTADSLKGLSDAGRIAYSQTLLRRGKADASNEQVSIYLLENPENFLIRQMLQSIDKLSVWEEQPNAFVIYPMPDINTVHSEFGPFLYKNQLIFTSARNEDLVNSNENSFNKEGYLTIFKATIEDENLRSVKKPKPFSTKWIGDYHVGPISIDTNNNKIYFSKVKSSLSKKKVHYMRAYEADLIKGKRVRKERESIFNADSSSTGHTSISPSGNVVCFASDRAGSMDLYISQRQAGIWSDPKPIVELNTELNELFPYLKNDSTLLFSSNGHPGYGGLDLFQSIFEIDSWSKPVNLKAPINSRQDDFSIFYFNESKGYFASDRDGGQGLDDIYQFIQLAEPAENSRTEIAGVFEYRGLPTEGITLKLLDEEDNELMVVQTDSNGKFDFGLLPSNDNYKIKIDEQTDEYVANSKIYLINDLGEKIIILGQEAGSLFVFKTLPQEEQDQLTLLEEEDAEMEEYDVFGQIFSTLDRDDYSTLSIDVYDEDGNFIKNVFLNEDGYYEIRHLSKTIYYKLALSEDGSEFTSTVYYDDGYSVKQFVENNSSLFRFSKLQVTPSFQISLPVTGSLLINNLGEAAEKVRIRLFDNKNENLGGALSDEEGFFKFENLEPETSYFLHLADSIDTVSSNTVEFFVLDINNNRVAKAKQISTSVYEFKTLSQNIYAVTGGTSPESDSDLIGQLFFKLPGDLNKELKMFANGEDGTFIEEVTVDSNGFFKFTKLKPNSKYSFSLSEVQDSEMSVYFYDNDFEVQDSIKFSNLSSFVYEQLQSMYDAKAPAQNIDANTTGTNTDVVGQLFFKLPGDLNQSLTIIASGEDGAFIEEVTVDSNGFFKFTKLKPDANYSFSLSEVQDNEMSVYFYDNDFEVQDSIQFSNLSSYVYELLQAEKAKSLTSFDENDKASDFNSNMVNGQIFKTLPGDYKQGIKIYAIDDAGNVIDSTYTDGKGNFEFSTLKKDETFTLSVADEVDTDLNIAFVNFEGHFEGSVKTDSSNLFVYSKIIIEAAAELGLDDYKDVVYEPLFGQLFKQLPGDYPTGTKIYAYDDDGNIIDIATIDDQGNFKFTKLLRDESYLFRTDDKNDDFVINVLDSEGSLVDRINVAEKTWAYTQLKREENKLTALDEQDNSNIGLPGYTPSDIQSNSINKGVDENKSTVDQQDISSIEANDNQSATAEEKLDISIERYKTAEQINLSSNQKTIYYNYKSYKLTDDDIEVLNMYVQQLRTDSSLALQMNSHTDPTEQTSQRSYSALRSVSIANYLYKNGVALDQIIITNWEDLKMAVDCPLEEECLEQERLQNMRSNLSIISKTQLPPAPDYIVYYDFDNWKLSKSGNNEMFRVLKEVQLTKNVEIVLDGYTDVWGGYEMNDRISELRVKNIQNLLISKGQNQEEIESIVHGESSPMGKCKLQYPCPLNEREQNRRVEVRINEKP